MYLIFGGLDKESNDYLKLMWFLSKVEHTLSEGSSLWKGIKLNSQTITAFDYDDAVSIRNYMKIDLKQLHVPMKEIVTIDWTD